jgi:protease-4
MATQPDGSVAVVSVQGTISSTSADPVIDNLREARQNDSIRAVVLDVNSGGGTVAASEALYLAVRRTAAVMPVAATVDDIAASGAYYTVLPSDRIYVKPGSVVGSVGVRATVPGQGVPANEIVTGPDKNGGGTEGDTRQRVEEMRRAFVGSVTEHRDLAVSAERLSYAKVYSGARGVNLGFVDRVGGRSAAVQFAATEAGLDDYRVVERGQLSGIPGLFGSNETAAAALLPEGVSRTVYLMYYGEIAGVTYNASA